MRRVRDDPSSDFRFTAGKNHGLGEVYMYVRGAMRVNVDYPGMMKFSDEGEKPKAVT